MTPEKNPEQNGRKTNKSRDDVRKTHDIKSFIHSIPGFGNDPKLMALNCCVSNKFYIGTMHVDGAASALRCRGV